MLVRCALPHGREVKSHGQLGVRASDTHAQGTGGCRLCSIQPPTGHYKPPPSRASTCARHAQTSKRKRPAFYIFLQQGCTRGRKSKDAFKIRRWRGGQKHMCKEQKVAASATVYLSKFCVNRLNYSTCEVKNSIIVIIKRLSECEKHDGGGRR